MAPGNKILEGADPTVLISWQINFTKMGCYVFAVARVHRRLQVLVEYGYISWGLSARCILEVPPSLRCIA